MPKNWAFFDCSVSAQAIVVQSKTNNLDLSGGGQTWAAGWGPVAGGISQGLDNGKVVNTAGSAGFAVGAKYTGGGVKTYTFTWPMLMIRLLNPVAGKW